MLPAVLSGREGRFGPWDLNYVLDASFLSL
jgi:hypothetical protein